MLRRRAAYCGPLLGGIAMRAKEIKVPPGDTHPSGASAGASVEQRRSFAKFGQAGRGSGALAPDAADFAQGAPFLIHPSWARWGVPAWNFGPVPHLARPREPWRHEWGVHGWRGFYLDAHRPFEAARCWGLVHRGFVANGETFTDPFGTLWARMEHFDHFGRVNGVQWVYGGHVLPGAPLLPGLTV